MAEVIDDPVTFTGAPEAARRRVPAVVAVPVILSCALVGYAISLVMPLHPRSAGQATAAGLTILETQPSSADATSATIPPTAAGLRAHPEQPELVRVQSARRQPAPALETGSVDAARERPGEVADRPAPGVPAAQGALRPETQARRLVPRRPRVVYRRPVPKKYSGPFDALWPTYPK